MTKTISEILAIIENEKARNLGSADFLKMINLRFLNTQQNIIDQANQYVHDGLNAFQNDQNEIAKIYYQKAIDLFPTCNSYFLLSMVEYDEGNYYQAWRWSIAASMFINKAEFNYWNAILLRNFCVLNLLSTNNEDWQNQQYNLHGIIKDYIIPNFEFYETQRKNYGLTELFKTEFENLEIDKNIIQSLLPPIGWIYNFIQDNKTELPN